MEAKCKHWTDYLKGTNADDIWTLNCYTKEPAGNGGNPQIPTLKVIGPDGFAMDINTNNGKANAFSNAFFPKPPQTSSMPINYQYPDPLPDPPMITCRTDQNTNKMTFSL